MWEPLRYSEISLRLMVEHQLPYTCQTTVSGSALRKEKTANARMNSSSPKGIKAGDSVAFGGFIREHRSECLKRAWLMLRNRSDARDEI